MHASLLLIASLAHVDLVYRQAWFTLASCPSPGSRRYTSNAAVDQHGRCSYGRSACKRSDRSSGGQTIAEASCMATSAANIIGTPTYRNIFFPLLSNDVISWTGYVGQWMSLDSESPDVVS